MSLFQALSAMSNDQAMRTENAQRAALHSITEANDVLEYGVRSVIATENRAANKSEPAAFFNHFHSSAGA